MTVYVLLVENDHEFPSHQIMGVYLNESNAMKTVNEREQMAISPDRWDEHADDNAKRFWSGHDQYFITKCEVKE